jgi:hypothetical protein
VSFPVPSDFQRGLIYTVHPRILAPLVPGEEYRILASTRIRLPQHAALPSYEPLYRRARLIARRRGEELSCQGGSGRPQTWIASHGWFRMDISDSALAGAVVVLGVACGSTPPGKAEPASDAFWSPYTSEMPDVGSLRDGTWDEFHNDFDMRSSVNEPAVLTVSYGEYVFARTDVDVDALTARALQRARSYFDLTEPGVDTTFVRREWACLETGKAARPLLAHVTLYFDPPSGA